MATIAWGVMVACFAVAQESNQPAPVRAPAFPPTHRDVKYGPHDRNLMDVWVADSSEPTPVLVSIHGGAFRHGDKTISNVVLRQCLASGISVATITYRFSDTAIAPAATSGRCTCHSVHTAHGTKVEYGPEPNCGDGWVGGCRHLDVARVPRRSSRSPITKIRSCVIPLD